MDTLLKKKSWRNKVIAIVSPTTSSLYPFQGSSTYRNLYLVGAYLLWKRAENNKDNILYFEFYIIVFLLFRKISSSLIFLIWLFDWQPCIEN